MKRLLVALASLTLLGLLAWLGWTRLSKPLGDQKVSFRPADPQCESVGPLRYCTYRAVDGVNGDLVYHLHGRGLDERIWNDDTYFTSLLQAYWQDQDILPPTIVTVSYGPQWLLAPQGRMADSGLLDDFIARMPAIEAKIGAPRRRLLLGESMGGLNALILGLSHPARFDKVAALCPGVYAESPFDSFARLKVAAERTGASPKIAFGIVQLARRYFADEAEWRRAAPLSRIEAIEAASAPALYLSCGLYDHYGNFEGTQQLASAARRRGIRTDWHPLYGGHCAIDVPSLARFIAASRR